jgi:2-dehydro-3-deoxyphosphogluconate aldolase/(4S)-4-hydroxy-2-oxoglutarate aldolase
MVAAGGVNQQTAENFILAGACALGVGTELIPTESIELRQSKRIRELARRFKVFVKEARERLETPKQIAATQKLPEIKECEQK